MNDMIITFFQKKNNILHILVFIGLLRVEPNINEREAPLESARALRTCELLGLFILCLNPIFYQLQHTDVTLTPFEPYSAYVT